ncbi:hypothetical protein MAM1_0064c03928 [Mucor ambiguus]|uniref:Phospholipid/glycerol acyltransferase domain-containing protein n=1 Tax=Mucor ambiguus TaxID=91626 RepID=A0A0C9MR34_9FUNG|nr:hypothetical protein MAM1_0064c03928 [Mucor ambiguus]
MVRINSKLVGTVWKVMQYVFERRKKAHITFSGDKIPFKENALILANHQAWTDIYLIHSVANRRDMLYNCKVSAPFMQLLYDGLIDPLSWQYFVKDSIKYLPFFGWGMWVSNHE